MTLDERQQHMLDNGFARIHRGRLIPVMRGGDETEEEKAAREKAEAAAAAAAAAPKTFTQAELDKIVQERLARAKAEPPADYEDLKAAKAKLDELEAANATELEKATKRAEEAEQKAAKAETAAKETRLTSAILAEASKADRKVVDPDAVLTLLDRSKLELDADGNPTNIAAAVDSLLEAKPYLAGGGTRVVGDVDQGARGGDKVTQLQSTEGMSAEQIAEAVAKGELDEYLKKPK